MAEIAYRENYRQKMGGKKIKMRREGTKGEEERKELNRP